MKITQSHFVGKGNSIIPSLKINLILFIIIFLEQRKFFSFIQMNQLIVRAYELHKYIRTIVCAEN